MKNITKCYSEQEVHDYIYGKFKTEEFRRSYREHGFIYDVVDRFAKMPRMFCQMSDDVAEWAHFSAWWGVIPERHYDNDAVSDLYYLHEMTHAGRMAYIPDMSFVGWSAKLFENELEASVTSEIQIYFELPGFRARSFPHEIYADRFLSDPGFVALWQNEPENAISLIKECRRDLYYAGPEIDQDMCARWVKRFARQNSAWADIWYRRYDEVENAMYELQRDSHNPTIGRQRALDRFEDWLLSDAVTPHGTEIPFPEEAHAFAGIYKKMKSDYFKDMESLKQRGVQHNIYHPVAWGPNT